MLARQGSPAGAARPGRTGPGTSEWGAAGNCVRMTRPSPAGPSTAPASTTAWQQRHPRALRGRQQPGRWTRRAADHGPAVQNAAPGCRTPSTGRTTRYGRGCVLLRGLPGRAADRQRALLQRRHLTPGAAVRRQRHLRSPQQPAAGHRCPGCTSDGSWNVHEFGAYDIVLREGDAYQGPGRRCRDVVDRSRHHPNGPGQHRGPVQPEIRSATWWAPPGCLGERRRGRGVFSYYAHVVSASPA